MKFIITVVFFLLSSIFSIAEEPIDFHQINNIITTLQSLHDTGVSIHKKYDLNNTNDVRECVANYGYLRTIAKNIQVKADNIKAFNYRIQLNQASYDAFACVYCGGVGESCTDIPPAINKVKEYLSKDGYQPSDK